MILEFPNIYLTHPTMALLYQHKTGGGLPDMDTKKDYPRGIRMLRVE